MRWLWVVCALIAGCKGQDGVLLDIPGEHVELFVGSAAVSCAAGPTECPITPPSMTNPAVTGTLVRGSGWFIDPMLLAVDGKNGHTLFQVQVELGTQGPTLANQQIPALLVVAYATSESTVPIGYALLTNLAVPQDSQTTITVELTPYDPAALRIWRKANDPAPHTHSACALVHAGDGTYTFFSPHDDADCDDAAPECDPFAFLGTAPPTDETLSCLVPVTSDSICRIGGGLCTDGQSMPGSECMRATGDPYCMPQAVCSGLAAAECDTFSDACANPVIDMTPTIACEVGVLVDVNGNQTPCTQLENFPLDLSTVIPSCSDIELAPLVAPLHFTHSLALAGTSIAVTWQSSCLASIDVTPGAITDPANALIDVQVDQPSSAHLVLPIVFAPTTGIGCTMRCYAPVLDSHDSIFQCQ